MGKSRVVNTAIWSDVWFEGLSPTEKLLFIYLITNDHNNMLGIYELSIRKMAFETGINSETIKKALESFETDGKVFYKDGYVGLINFIKHQSYNTNMKTSAINSYNALPPELKIENLQQINSKDINKGFQTLVEGFGILRNIKFNLIEYNLIKEEKDFDFEKLKENFAKYSEYIKKQSVQERLAMNLCISSTDIPLVVNEFLDTCYATIAEQTNPFQVEQYFGNWVRAKNGRVEEAINNQVKKQKNGAIR